ncbi:hypothetical protein DSO57_1010886 [Entomophthora muscae]|uniref:Uncharacterized protein n=1 Tax=Entomophthora muscae TaxID=34485 RepID=A0ACC2SJC8_9FUNG|nr:hypothetical protein DSO57_1010886 [Entomophthora muscae]
MKHFDFFIFAALVSGLSRKFDVVSIEDLCSIKASVFSIDPIRGFRTVGEVPLKNESYVTACKAMSGAKVFRKLYLGSMILYSEEEQLKIGKPELETIDLFYEHANYKFYDGLEFNFDGLRDDMVDRLLKERHSGQLFSLVVPLGKWPEVGSIIRKYAAKIHHVELNVYDNEESLATLKDLLKRNPEIAFSVSISKEMAKAKIVARNAATSLSRKVGYTMYLTNPNSNPLTYTADI